MAVVVVVVVMAEAAWSAGSECGSPQKRLTWTVEATWRAKDRHRQEDSPWKPLTWKGVVSKVQIWLTIEATYLLRAEDVGGPNPEWMEKRKEERRVSWWRKGVCVRIQTVTKQTNSKHGMGKKLPTPQPHTFYDLVKISLA